MAYVDLNPIRAKIAKTPEDSNHTSVQEHIIAHQQQNKIKLSNKLKQVLKSNPQNPNNTPKHLKAFSQVNIKNDHELPIERESYLELVDYTVKAIKSGKLGAIPENLKPILTRLKINPTHWVSTVSTYKQAFGKVVGSIAQLDDWRNNQNQKDETNTKWLKGNKAARDLYA